MTDLDRCERELREIEAADNSRTAAYLVAMGRFDWEWEKRKVEEEYGCNS